MKPKNVSTDTFSEMCEEFQYNHILQQLEYFDIYERWSNGESLEEAIPVMRPLPMSEVEWIPKLNSRKFDTAQYITAVFNVTSESGRSYRYKVNLSSDSYSAPSDSPYGHAWGLTFDREGSYGQHSDMGAESGTVFATVVMIVNKFKERRLPRMVKFSAMGASRTSLYKALSKKFAGETFDIHVDYGSEVTLRKGTGEYARTVTMPQSGTFTLRAKADTSTNVPLVSLADLNPKEPVAIFRKQNGRAVAVHMNTALDAAGLKELKHLMHVYQMSIRDAKAVVLKALLPIAYPELDDAAKKTKLNALLKSGDQNEWATVYRLAEQASPSLYAQIIGKAMSKPQFRMDFVKLATASWAIGYFREHPGSKPPELIVMNLDDLKRYIARSRTGAV